MSDATEHVENVELIEKLKTLGHVKLMEVMLSSDVYFRTDNLNKTACAKLMCCSVVELEVMLKKCKDALS